MYFIATREKKKKRSSSPFLNAGYWYEDHMHVDLRECSSRKPFVCIQMTVILFLFSLSLSLTYLFFVVAAAVFFKYTEKEYKSKMFRLILVRYHFGIGIEIGMQCYCTLINLVENVIALNVECVCFFFPFSLCVFSFTGFAATSDFRME